MLAPLMYYVKKLLEVGAMQRVIIITPTWASNKDIFAPLNIQEEDVIEPSKSALATVVSRVEQEKKDHDEYLVKRRKYKEFQKAMRSATCIEAIPTSIMVEALNAGFFEGPPKWKRDDDSHPTFCMLIIDDCLSLPMMMEPKLGPCEHLHQAQTCRGRPWAVDCDARTDLLRHRWAATTDS